MECELNVFVIYSYIFNANILYSIHELICIIIILHNDFHLLQMLCKFQNSKKFNLKTNSIMLRLNFIFCDS